MGGPFNLTPPVESRTPRPEVRNRGRRSAGFTLVEVVVAVTLFSVLLAAVLMVLRSSMRNSAQVFASEQLEDSARDLLNKIVEGDTFVSPTLNGLVEGSEVAVSTTPVPALGYKVTGITSTGVKGHITITYYLDYGKLYRTVADYGTSLVLTTAGGVEMADSVEGFGLSVVVDPVSGRKLVSIDLQLRSPSGEFFSVKATVLPRNQPSGT